MELCGCAAVQTLFCYLIGTPKLCIEASNRFNAVLLIYWRIDVLDFHFGVTILKIEGTPTDSSMNAVFVPPETNFALSKPEGST